MKETDYDSAFSSKQVVFTKIDLGPDRLLANNNPICSGEGYTIDAKLQLALVIPTNGTKIMLHL
jgi:hypothetical protein